MGNLEVVNAEEWHADEMAPHIRAGDRLEIEAFSGSDIAGALRRSIAKSTEAFTVLEDGRPICMFGVGLLSFGAGIGSPWLIGTDDIRRHKREFLKNSRKYVGEISQIWPVLQNCVDVRNKESITWLKWLGFQLHDAIPYGVQKRDFYPFEMRQKHV